MFSLCSFHLLLQTGSGFFCFPLVLLCYERIGEDIAFVASLCNNVAHLVVSHWNRWIFARGGACLILFPVCSEGRGGSMEDARVVNGAWAYSRILQKNHIFGISILRGATARRTPWELPL